MLNTATVKAAGIYCVSSEKIEFFRIFAYKNAIQKVR